MGNFTTIRLSLNSNGNSTQNWRQIGAASTEVRWSDQGTGLLTTPSASWPAMIRPGSTTLVNYTYAYLTDNGATNTAYGVYGGTTGNANPATFNSVNMPLFARWEWDDQGDFASPPIFTAYDTTAHNSPSARNTGALLSGHNTDTTGGGNARSYLKANAWGRVTTLGAPVGGDGNGPAAPLVTHGSDGSASPTAGANWMATYQGLMADIDYITAAAEPGVATDSWVVIFAVFTGPNQTPATNTPVLSLKYTYT